MYMQLFITTLFSNCFIPLLNSFSAKESESKSQWKLCFKLYCLLDADSISVDTIEYLFLFEQVIHPTQTLKIILGAACLSIIQRCNL